MNRLQKFAKSLLPAKNTSVEVKTKKRPSGSLDTSTPVDRVKMDMDKLISAAEDAVSPTRPDRRELIAIYEKASKDAHVISQFEIAKSKLVGEPFIISRGGEEDPELTADFKKPWFEEFLKLCFESEMWGYTLIEFGQIKNGDWSEVIEFPRRHIEPFSKQILIRPGDYSGIPYGDKPEALFLLEMGKPKDLGRLEVISREIIWKNFSRTDWSQASEKFGMPILYVKLGTDDEKEIDRVEKLCKNFAANGYIIVTTDDEVSILETAKSDIFKIYEMNARFCDEQISKCTNGQTSSSDQKAYVGAAQVHEHILDDFHSSRLRHASNLVNYSLFPFLMYHGRDLTDCSFRFPSLDVKSMPDNNDPQNNPEEDPNLNPANNLPAGNKESGIKKKAPTGRVNTSGLGYTYAGGVILPLEMLGLPERSRGIAASKEVFIPKTIVDNFIKGIYDKVLFDGNIDPDLWNKTWQEIFSGFQTGFGKSLAKIKYGTPDFAYLQQVRFNTAVFSAFKQNQQIKEAASYLLKPDGSSTSWKEFLKIAMEIDDTYNKRWLQTEFNQAHNSALQARRWRDAEKTADLYPNFMYKAVMDERTRESHRKLNGMIRPISDPIWDTYSPPIDWGCRCTLRRTDKDPTDVPADIPVVADGLAVNTGKLAKIFSDDHPYIKGSADRADELKQFVKTQLDSE
jgi:SPP1 gp7 family putative phage head morphogenesis protein